MPPKKKKSTQKAKPKKLTPTQKLKRRVRNWKRATTLLAGLLLIAFFYNTNFTFQRTVLKLGQSIGIVKESYDLEGRKIFESNGITYVAYEHPLVEAIVVFDPDCESQACDIDSLKAEILTNLSPAIAFRQVERGSNEADAIVSKMGIRSLPAFIFDEEIKMIGNFAFIEDFFIEKNNLYLLKTPPGTYVDTPHFERANVKGPDDALVKLTYFSSYTCAFCADLHEFLERLALDFPTEIQIRMIHFNRGGIDTDLIQAAECSAEQNKFFEMSNLIFENQSILIDDEGVFNNALIATFAVELELDTESFSDCLKDTARFRNKLQSMQRTIADFAIQTVPSFFIEDMYETQLYTEKELRNLVISEIESKREVFKTDNNSE